MGEPEASALMPNRYALTGRVVTVDDDWTVFDRGAVYVSDDKLVRVQDASVDPPDGFAAAPRIATRGTIYPGLIELHNHLSYNVLPMWPPTKVYQNRGQWAGIEAYRKAVSGPMTVLGKTLGLPQAVVRYVEAKCLVAGVTTSQGVALYSNNGIQKFYRGSIRNVEDTRKVELEDASTKIADVEATSAADFLVRLQKGHRLILHLAEGLGDTARQHFTALHLADGRWALAPSLVAIHSNGLRAEDFDVLHDNGVGSCGAAEQPVAVRRHDRCFRCPDAGRAGRLGLRLVAEREPEPPGRAEGGSDREPDAVAGAVRRPGSRRDGDPEPGKDPGLGKGARVTRGGAFRRPARRRRHRRRPYDHLLTASERDISLVVVGGVARFGRASVMAALNPGAAFESVTIGGLDRRLNFVEADADPLVRCAHARDGPGRASAGAHAARRAREAARGPAAGRCARGTQRCDAAVVP